MEELTFLMISWLENLGSMMDNISVYNPKFDVWMEMDLQLPKPRAYMGVAYHQVV